ncbi:MAG: T9SS type A sorting domain-containing protein [Bacteroidota bacterium]
MKQNVFGMFLIIFIINSIKAQAQPDWWTIKTNATFIVPDPTYETPYIQPLNVGGWEDGLSVSRDGLMLYALYMPVDVFSLFSDFALNPVCFDFHPYYRPPLFGIDTLTNPWGCPNFFQADIVYSFRISIYEPFIAWFPSNMARSVSTEGAPQAISKSVDSVDLFVYTRNGDGTQDMDIMFMKNVTNNPNQTTAVPIVQSPQNEDNPHIERISATQLVLLFDRERYIYYSLSNDNGLTWQTPVQVTNVLNDYAPYDVQPHLWNDGTDWWVYYCAQNSANKRCIYKSKQQIANDWNSWGLRELVIEPNEITGGSGIIAGIGEPTLTARGDLSFVVIYGDPNSTDTTDVYDADPWFLPKRWTGISESDVKQRNIINCYPNPACDFLNIELLRNEEIKLRMYNLLGEKVLELELNTSRKMDVSGLTDGVYFIRATSESGILFTQKVIISKR